MSIRLGSQDLFSYFDLHINVYLANCLHLVKKIPPKVFPCIYSILDNKAMSKLLSFPEGKKKINSLCPACRDFFFCVTSLIHTAQLATATLDEVYLKIWHA